MVFSVADGLGRNFGKTPMKSMFIAGLAAFVGACLLTGCGGETKKEEAKPAMTPEQMKDSYKGVKQKNFSTGG